ncbi:hypothetical protein SAMN06297468_1194 [Altererythrobacter xiamenensis]|uniref:Uncharacterized protein n=2 Tax=Altererythrobacter xiamenensis TaxID=1316679 RepID=A0A1Y6F975_9SPHN|nr:hypothetical protein SAMN06297468_1194 [Altererythrobacter xiamenensis]
MMSSLRYHSTGSNAWSPDRRPLDPTQRRARFGPILPMGESPRSGIFGLFSRL